MEANFTLAKDNFEMPVSFAATIECADDLMAEKIVERALRSAMAATAGDFRSWLIRRAQPASRASVGSLRSRLGKAVVFS